MINNNQKDIINMFDSIANSYDITNRILSFGIDINWRKEACKLSLNALSSKDKINILDVACGTGDMILHWIKYANNIESIIGLDPSCNMLDIAKSKLPSNVNLINGEATSINLDNDSIDILSIAYGLRNIVDLETALKEFFRILRHNGILVILEFTRKENQNIFDKLALFYTTNLLPLIGGLMSKNYKAYKYLPDSIKSFLTLEELEEKLNLAGFLFEFKKRYFGNLCSLIIVKKQ